ncbi:FtsQ-type POTRA domain-containing protein [Streptomyces sp. TRM43335]|uniref:Cell division protein FtsQ n=1 Tax=Streptomyces taklimakanensis TaxID=2569853 RepID=A0A6G2B8Q6_9ACTN|nr:FtsQ-type POTRA domain-containing protein [Streptomyces taklimakanensis]
MVGRTGAERDGARRRPEADSAPPPAAPRPRPGGPGRPHLRARRLPLVLALAPALLLGGFALWVLYGSAWLRVEEVTAEGERVLTEREVLRAAEVPVGEPLVSVDPEAVERRLLDGLSRIDSVDVTRSWPHGVEVAVTERKPVAVMVQNAPNGEGGSDEDGARERTYVEVDDEGVRFGTVAERPDGVPVLALELDDSPSRHRFGEERMREEAVKVAAALSDAVRRDTRAIRVRSHDSITLEMAGGRTVVWGSSEKSAAKARSLSLLMKAAEDARRFDVSVPTAPAASGS